MNRRDREYWSHLVAPRQRMAALLQEQSMRCREEAQRLRAADDATELPAGLLSAACSSQAKAAIEAAHARLYLFHLIDGARR